MKSLFTILLCCLFTTFLFSQSPQYLPFQGRLTNNSGLVLNGSYGFTFEILGSAYSETFVNVPVNNGLYALVLGSSACCPLPNNLFLGSNSRLLKISVNGLPLDTVAIYPSLKGNIFWSEIQSKPSTLYVDSTFEKQKLSINGNALTISNGNTVNLPIPTQSNHFANDIYVGSIDTTINTPINVANTNITQQIISTAWQSFSLNTSASLVNIKIQLGNTNNSDIMLKIYPGIGNGGQAIYTYYYNCNNFSSAFGQQTFVINSTQALVLQGNSDYTFEIQAFNSTVCNPTNSLFILGRDNANPYSLGIANLGVNTDLVFSITTKQISNYNLKTSDSAIVFGTPVVKAVNGRFYDKTGLVQPVGSIIAFGGTVAPAGWLLCDGTSFPINQYPDLYAVIHNNFGGTVGATFNLPDLRGRFLRGVDGIAGNDPDKVTRTAMNTGGNTGNNVGSVQSDELKSHNHANAHLNPTVKVAGGTNHFSSFDPTQYSYNGYTLNTGGLETRPKNVYVNYIIKY